MTMRSFISEGRAFVKTQPISFKAGDALGYHVYHVHGWCGECRSGGPLWACDIHDTKTRAD